MCTHIPKLRYWVPYVKIFDWDTQPRGFRLVGVSGGVRVRVGQVNRVSGAVSGTVYSNSIFLLVTYHNI